MENSNIWQTYCSDEFLMEIDLSELVWPVCVLRCNEVLTQLQPGEELVITLCDPDVVKNVLLLVKSQPDLRSTQSQEKEFHRITVHRMKASQEDGAHPVQRTTHARSY
jgi:TusA-related sulfurtransferase